MRLDKLIIGSDKVSPTHQFKNLKNVTIDFDQDHWVTVVIGWNGSGKSNVLEALAIIFRDLITYQGSTKKTREEIPRFAFKLWYRIGAGDNLRHVHIDADPDRKGNVLVVRVGLGDMPQAIKLQSFLDVDAGYLPRHVFSYYSGESQRMQEVFEPYLKDYYQKLVRSKVDPAPKRLFFALPVHSQFVLLAFLIQADENVKQFLENELGIDPNDGIESVLFVLRDPPWNSEEGDPRFWNARGLVQRFLDRLMTASMAPITVRRKVKKSIWNKNKSEREYQYLYVKDAESLRALVGNQAAKEFFRDLESTYVSELIEEVRIRVRLKKNDGSVTFRELSEGEQQLLTVLGLLRFTAEDESLFLLDEPDTHLNPRWCVDYLSYLKSFIGQSSEGRNLSHILLTTHNPLAIAELDREQVQILRMHKQDGHRQVVACYPEMAPRGMGYAAIVTSDMFGIASSLDQPTQELLEAQRAYAAKEKLTVGEQRELDEINSALGRLGFRFFHPDDEYSRYLRLRNELLAERFKSEDPKELAKAVVQMSRADRESLAKRLIGELLSDEQESEEWTQP